MGTGRAPEIVGSLATAPEGATIRKIMTEADTLAFVDKLLSETTFQIQTKAVGILATTLQEKLVSGADKTKPIKLAKKPVSQHSSKAVAHILRNTSDPSSLRDPRGSGSSASSLPLPRGSRWPPPSGPSAPPSSTSSPWASIASRCGVSRCLKLFCKHSLDFSL